MYMHVQHFLMVTMLSTICYRVWQTLDYRWHMESSVSSLHVSCGGNGACVRVCECEGGGGGHAYI